MYNEKEIHITFIDEENYIICNNCLEKLIKTNKIEYIETNIEEIYKSKEKFKKPLMYCDH
jgi:hypothetical protein